MSQNITLQTRRQFLRTGILGGALSWTVPVFLSRTFSAMAGERPDKDAPILVILQMAGGNDGLNTVVPYRNDFYHKARPKIGLAENAVLKINDEIGLPKSLAGFKDLYDAGQLSILQGVGYPNPNRSHFRSTEIWQTASDENKTAEYGWIGRYFDNACPGADPTVGISLTPQAPQAFNAKTPTGVTLDNPQNFRFNAGPRAKDGEMNPDEKSYRELNGITDGSDNSGATIGAIGGAIKRPGSAMDFLERTALDAQVSSDKILEVTRRIKTSTNYPGSQLGNSLKLVGKLIAGGLPTRVFYASQGGYDTHTNQVGQHARLLQDLGDSVKAFVQDLQAQGNLSRVLLITFSEFGRRLAENASGGTDHGAAAPLFVVGHAVKAGVHGAHPSLAPADLLNGDAQFQIDFRSVYAAALEQWLRTPSEPILGRKFAPLPLV
ncbi:MAG TPA: DUF1501 domain-containing protein [Verrucomicrobiae bacterium]|jgi:uncharacterized protein (DUF1501 family)|nr:DUF1501 domain-containing protein [Verrucomicrobiae bacterium]